MQKGAFWNAAASRGVLDCLHYPTALSRLISQRVHVDRRLSTIRSVRSLRRITSLLTLLGLSGVVWAPACGDDGGAVDGGGGLEDGSVPLDAASADGGEVDAEAPADGATSDGATDGSASDGDVDSGLVEDAGQDASDGGEPLEDAASDAGDACPPSTTGDPCDTSRVCRVAVDGSSDADGSDWGAQARALQAALDDPECDELWLLSGVYLPVIVAEPTSPTQAEREASIVIRREVEVYGGFDGTQSVRSARDSVAHPTILSGDIDGNDNTDGRGVTPTADDIVGTNSYHVLWVDGTDAPITATTLIDGITVCGGHADELDPYTSEGDGAGLYCDGEAGECSPTLRDVVFNGNAAVYLGGALYARAVNGNSSPVLERVVFRGNAAGQSGGAVFGDARGGTSTPVYEDVVFDGNRADFSGGALYNFAADGTSSPSLARVTFSDNSATGEGGAMASVGAGEGVSDPMLINSTLSANRATDGAGLFNHGRGGMSSPALSYVTVSGNTASNQGGAIHSAQTSGGESLPDLANVIVWGNTAAEGAALFNDGAMPTLRYGIVAGGCPAATTCEMVMDVDPGLGALGDNGGFSHTMVPASPGPAIDMGSAAGCPMQDQRGISRPQGAQCDLGAVEVVP